MLVVVGATLGGRSCTFVVGATLGGRSWTLGCVAIYATLGCVSISSTSVVTLSLSRSLISSGCIAWSTLGSVAVCFNICYSRCRSLYFWCARWLLVLFFNNAARLAAAVMIWSSFVTRGLVRYLCFKILCSPLLVPLYLLTMWSSICSVLGMCPGPSPCYSAVQMIFYGWACRVTVFPCRLAQTVWHCSHDDPTDVHMLIIVATCWNCWEDLAAAPFVVGDDTKTAVGSCQPSRWSLKQNDLSMFV